MRLAAFVDDADVLGVDAGQAGVTGSAAFVEEPVMRRWPGAAVVEADLDRVVGSPFLRVRVREQQHMLVFGFRFRERLRNIGRPRQLSRANLQEQEGRDQ